MELSNETVTLFKNTETTRGTLIKFLSSSRDLNKILCQKDSKGWLLFHIIAKYQSDKLTEFIFNRMSIIGFHYALDTKDCDGYIFSHFIFNYGDYETIKYVLNHEFTTKEQLIQQTSKYKFTPLHHLLGNKRLVVEDIMDIFENCVTLFGEDLVYIEDNDNNFPLFRIASWEPKSKEIVLNNPFITDEMLLRRNSKGKNGFSIIFENNTSSNIVDIILSKPFVNKDFLNKDNGNNNRLIHSILSNSNLLIVKNIFDNDLVSLDSLLSGYRESDNTELFIEKLIKMNCEVIDFIIDNGLIDVEYLIEFCKDSELVPPRKILLLRTKYCKKPIGLQ